MTELLRHVVTSAVPEAQAETARDAEGALAKFRDRPPDLMLLDLNLPGMSGVELCMYLRGLGEGQRCTVVAVSGTASASDMRLLDQLGITHYIAKGPELSARLTTLLRELARRIRGENG
jgi:DNA-binding response OmpR family regulator